MTATASNSDARKRQERQQGEHLTHWDAGVRAVIEREVAKERERIAQAIEAERPEMGLHINVTDYRRGMDDALIKAARIAREAGQP